MPSNDRPDAPPNGQQQRGQQAGRLTQESHGGAHSHPLAGDATLATPPAGTQPTTAELVDQVFSRFDADSDGSISLAEALNAIDPNGTSTELVTKFTSAAASIDGNADGSLSKEELSTAIATQSKAANQLLDAARWAAHAANDEDFGAHDAAHDHEDASNDNVLMSLFGSSGRTIDFTALASSVFTQIDSNADNVLSAEEVAAAVALVDTTSFDASVLGTLDTSAIASIVTNAAHPEVPLDHFDQLSVELIGVLARALNPHDCGG